MMVPDTQHPWYILAHLRNSIEHSHNEVDRISFWARVGPAIIGRSRRSPRTWILSGSWKNASAVCWAANSMFASNKWANTDSRNEHPADPDPPDISIAPGLLWTQSYSIYLMLARMWVRPKLICTRLALIASRKDCGPDGRPTQLWLALR